MQIDITREAGYTTTDVGPKGGQIGLGEMDGASLVVPIYDLPSQGTIEVHYGTSGVGLLQRPKVAKDSFFTIETKGSPDGDFVEVTDVPAVVVRPQASGRGEIAIDTGGDVYAGDTGRSIEITYTSIGEIENGRLRLALPPDWTEAKAANFDISSGSSRFPTKFGGRTGAELEDDEDLAGTNQLVVSGINLAAGRTITIDYTDVAVQETTGDATFAIDFDGSKGPDEGEFIALSEVLTVEVGQARAGSGDVEIDQMGEVVVAASTGNELTVTYTAIGEIGEEKQITVEVPAGWSAPITDAAADDKLGTFAVAHSTQAC